MPPQTRNPRPIARSKPKPHTGWLAITGLLLLSVIPVLGGILSLPAAGADAEGVLAWPSAIAAVTHIVTMSAFCLVGAFQFSPALRTRRGWHRAAGRVLLPAGVLAALSAAWLAVFFSGPRDEFTVAMVRLVFAAVMTVLLVWAGTAIRRRDLIAHGAWMTRAYAIGVAGGTQALVAVPWALVVGDVEGVAETWVVAAGFVINAGVAELVIRRRRIRRERARRRESRMPGRSALVS